MQLGRRSKQPEHYYPSLCTVVAAAPPRVTSKPVRLYALVFLPLSAYICCQRARSRGYLEYDAVLHSHW
jgi:hypothetical protein